MDIFQMPKKRLNKKERQSKAKPPASFFFHIYSTKRKYFLAFATLLFALAISFQIIIKLAEQGRNIPYTTSLVVFIFSLLLHYIFIYKKKDTRIPLFHHKHHLRVFYFYFFVFFCTIIFTSIAHYLSGTLITISEFLFLISVGTIISLVTYEISY